MNYCCLECPPELLQIVETFVDHVEGAKSITITLPITASQVDIDLLVVSPSVGKFDRLAATVCDWNLPPATLMVMPVDGYEAQKHYLAHHPRMGRAIFFCKDEPAAIKEGLGQITEFYQAREALKIDNSISGLYLANNISPRWLLQALMEHLDQFIYFKDRSSNYLAVSRYMSEACSKGSPTNVLGLNDFDLFDEDHAIEAFEDEQRIIKGEIAEVSKEEFVTWDGNERWVTSRKLPLHTRSGYMAGTFGLSRDITIEKNMHQKIEANHERMQQELLLARNLQDTLMSRNLPSFIGSNGRPSIEIATKYLPSFLLSGDYFNVIKTPSHGVGILIADVMGHGVRAAMVTAMLQVATHQFESLAEKPAKFMAALNEMLHELMAPCGEVFFATAAYVYIDIENEQLCYVQAGARHGLYYTKDSSEETKTFGSTPVSPALGLLPDAPFTESTAKFRSGDQLLLYTDGILEATKAEEEFGFKRVKNCLVENSSKSQTEILDALLQEVHDFTGEESLDDDLCLVAIRMP
jgi:sigma-B regulation protein RsbU (phosphoserine phosphatase)